MQQGHDDRHLVISMSERPKWRVFVSSVDRGDFSEYRRNVKEAIEALGHDPVVMGITEPSMAVAPQQACLGAIAECDVVILLLGRHYGDDSTGKSPTHQEWEHARDIGKPILVFKEDVNSSEIEERQREFISEVSDFESGRFRTSFATSRDLLLVVVGALNRHAEQSLLDAGSDPSAGLPPGCRERLDLLRSSDLQTATRMTALMVAPSSRQAGALARLVDEPPEWLRDASFAAWETLASFLDSYGLDGGTRAWERAIERGSPSSTVHLAHLAGVAIESGDTAAAEGYVAGMPPDRPLTLVMREVIGGNLSGAVDLVLGSRLHESGDDEEALHCVMVLTVAYAELEQFDTGREMLRSANERFPGRGSLLFHQAVMTALLAEQTGIDAAASYELFDAVVEGALQARGLLREWQGQSEKAAALAMKASLALDDPRRAIVIGAVAPDGGATERESAYPDVQLLLAQAWLMLGQPERIDTLNLRSVEQPDAAYIAAMQAHAAGDVSAPSRLRRAVDQAHDEDSLRRALLGLAFCGQTDDDRAAELPDKDSAFLRALAASTREDHEVVLRELAPYCFDSAMHADRFARSQFETGHHDEAVATLLDAAEHLGSDSLRVTAAEFLFDQNKLEESEQIAQEVLGRLPKGIHKRRAQRLLFYVAERRQDWRAMESRARAWVDDFPEDSEAPWRVVYALHHQVLNRQAWAYISARSLVPIDEHTAALSIVVANSADMIRHDVDSVLDLAEQYRDSELVLGRALLTIAMQGEDFELDDSQQERCAALQEAYFAQFPDGSTLQQQSFENQEEFAAAMRQFVQNRAVFHHDVTQQVRFGNLPYGLLHYALKAPYAEVLGARAATDLSSISFDWEERQQETVAAYNAVGGMVVADTSVAALGILTEFDVLRVSGAFERVLVPDELIYDARLSLQLARASVKGTLIHDFGTGQDVFYEYSEEERATAQERPGLLLDFMEQWLSVNSTAIQPADYEGGNDLRPWDAAIRLALERQVPLWCDDLALRRYARQAGVETFGTWALYEVLAPQADWSWLPDTRTFLIRLLRARIADVPLPVAELVKTARHDDGSDEALAILLQRPHLWAQDGQNTQRWYLLRMETLIHESCTDEARVLMYSACFGRGITTEEQKRADALGEIPGSTILCADDPEIVPHLVDAARQASNVIVLGEGPDPLDAAVRHLVRATDLQSDSESPARGVADRFTHASADDREIVSRILAEVEN